MCIFQEHLKKSPEYLRKTIWKYTKHRSCVCCLQCFQHHRWQQKTINDTKNIIRDLREDSDLRQIDVANATGIDQKTLSNYETGKTNPDSHSIIKLAEFFNVTTDYLLCLSDYNIKTDADILKILNNIEKQIKNIKRHYE